MDDEDLRARDQRPTPPIQELVGLALRAHRRLRGQSQRAYAADRGLDRAGLARAEVNAGSLRLSAAVELLKGTGYELAIIPVSAEGIEPWWDPTDVLARTRGGARFPPHREVIRSPAGPTWFWYHEMFGRRGSGIRPKWTAEGFEPPPGTRYGKEPTPGPDGGPRWPFNDPYGDKGGT